MSATRSIGSQQPRRMSSKLAGSIDHSSLGRPTTAFRPICGYRWPSKVHTSMPPSITSTRGAASANASGIRPSNIWAGSTRWSSTETITGSSSGS